ncbi:MAG TPA: hypothetical protein VGK29_12290 [Paludibaculum sp.]|jgi:hypothetical protein
MEREVLEFTAQYFRVKPESLSLRTRPYPDLCLDDTWMEAFLWRFSQHFGVSFPTLNNHHAWAYFVQNLPMIPEVGLLFWVPAALWLWLTGGGSFRNFDDTRLSPWLTLADLTRAATRAAPRPELSGTPPHTAE